jgi:hypothetical protein
VKGAEGGSGAVNPRQRESRGRCLWAATLSGGVGVLGLTGAALAGH